MTNIPASIHQRLLNEAKAGNRPFNEVLQYYTIERFLYRLGKSAYVDTFVLKGAFTFLAWQTSFFRPTRDIDLLGFTENSIDNLVGIIKKICTQPVMEDGLSFDIDSVEGEIITEATEYPGIRIKFLAYLGKAKVHMQIDVGFGDVVTPPPTILEIVTILYSMDKPMVRVYPPESVIAEKFHAMVFLGLINSRMKDFYDVWKIVETMELNFGTVRRAIYNTFRQRSTPIPEMTPIALTENFAILRQNQWFTFCRNNLIPDIRENLLEVIQLLRSFIDP